MRQTKHRKHKTNSYSGIIFKCFVVFAFFLSALILLSHNSLAAATTYYVDSNPDVGGDDTYDGRSPSTPWKTINKVNLELESGTILPGDAVLFKCGEQWREYLRVAISGTSESDCITFGSYGEGEKPIFNGAQLLINWEYHDGSVWKSQLEGVPVAIEGWIDAGQYGYPNHWFAIAISKPDKVYFLPLDGNPAFEGIDKGDGSLGLLTDPGDWCWFDDDAGTTAVVIYSEGNPGVTYECVYTDILPPTIPESIYFVEDGESYCGSKKENINDLINEHDWFAQDSVIYVYSVSDPANIYDSVEIPVRESGIQLNSVDYITIQDLCVLHTGVLTGVGINVYNSNNIILKNLDVHDGAGYAGISFYSDVDGRGQDNKIAECKIYNMTATSGALAVGNKGDGISLCGPTDASFINQNTVDGNTIFDNGGSGISIVNGSYNTISSNTVYGNGDCGLGVASGIPEAGTGLLVSSNNIIERNIVYGNCTNTDDRFGINLFRAGDNNIVRYNIVYNQCDYIENPLIPSNPGYGGYYYGSGGIRFDGGDITLGADNDYVNSVGNKAYYNIVYGEFDGIQIFNFSNVEIYNNVVYDSSRYGIAVSAYNDYQQPVPGTPVTGTIVKNNTVYLLSDIGHSLPNQELVYQSNCIDTQNSNNLHNLNPLDPPDPLFVDAENRDFHLQTNSPCKDGGTDVGLLEDFDGNIVGENPNIGAFEYATDTCPMIALDMDGNSLHDIVIDFGNEYGIWAYMNNSSWEPIHNLSCASMQKADLDADPKDDLILDFGIDAGIWILYNNQDWSRLHVLPCDQIIAVDRNNDNIDEIIIDFGGEYGIWEYDPQGQAWTQLHVIDPESIDAADDEVIVIDFGQEYGIWALTPDPENPWMFVHPLSPEFIEIADIDNDGTEEGIMNFGEYGIWIYDDGIWTQLHHISPASITPLDIDGQQGKDLVIDFGEANGIWTYFNNSSWTKLHDLSPDWISGANLDNDGSHKDDLVIDFGPEHGIWKNENQSADWQKIHDLSV